MNAKLLRRQNNAFRDTGGISQNNGSLGFLPAFLDEATGAVYRSCYADGTPAPFHILEGLPSALCVVSGARGSARQIRDTVIAGFVKEHTFYTREEAARAVAGQ